MTTVCFDGKTLVSDSQATAGDSFIVTNIAKKVHTPKEGEYWDYNGRRVLAFGLAGDPSSIEYIKEGLSEGLTHKTSFSASSYMEFDALLVMEDATSVIFSGWLNNGVQTYHSFEAEVPACIGTGTPFALAVIESNKKNQAVKGLKAAIKFCAYTGGDLQIWELPPIPEVRSVRPITTMLLEEKKEDSNANPK